MYAIYQAVLTGAIGIIVALITAGTHYVVNLIKAKTAEYETRIGSQQFKVAQDIANNVVVAVEQSSKVLGIELGVNKLEEATNRMRRELAEHGIDLTDEQVHTLIEASVGAMNGIGNAVQDVLTK